MRFFFDRSIFWRVLVQLFFVRLLAFFFYFRIYFWYHRRWVLRPQRPKIWQRLLSLAMAIPDYQYLSWLSHPSCEQHCLLIYSSFLLQRWCVILRLQVRQSLRLAFKQSLHLQSRLSLTQAFFITREVWFLQLFCDFLPRSVFVSQALWPFSYFPLLLIFISQVLKLSSSFPPQSKAFSISQAPTPSSYSLPQS